MNRIILILATVALCNTSFAADENFNQAGSNGTAIIASIQKVDDEYDLQTLSDLMIALKRENPGQDAASVLMESHIPYDYLIQVMDIVRSVEVAEEGTDEYQLFALFTEISVGDAP